MKRNKTMRTVDVTFGVLLLLVFVRRVGRRLAAGDNRADVQLVAGQHVRRPQPLGRRQHFADLVGVAARLPRRLPFRRRRGAARRVDAALRADELRCVGRVAVGSNL